jgi:glycosyltransferase involved in cell wall biosynthesis
MASYRQNHILLFPSIWVEPFGMAVIEAMAQGLCVIASDHGGPIEHITHGENGMLVPAEDPDAMAAAILRLAKNPDLAKRIRRAALRTVRNRYAFDTIADQIEEYLIGVATKGHNH